MLPPTLDDALTAFMACEPGDAGARRRLRESLWSILRAGGLRSAVRVALADAIAMLDDPAAFAPDREAGALVQLRLILETAADRVEDPPTLEMEARRERLQVPADADPSLVSEFAAEAAEYLERAEEALLRLEADPADAEAVNDVFRAFHTIKGTSAFLGLEAISTFAHHAEGMFARVRGAELPFSGAVPELALRAVDMLRTLVHAIPAATAGALVLPADYASLQRALGDPVAAAPASRTAPVAPSAPAAPVARPAPAESVKVRTEKLDRLVEMVGELVIAHGILMEDAVVCDATQQGLARKVQHAEKIVRELHDISLGLRMVPLKGALTKLARVVRDLALRSGKQIAFETSGEETELDRTLVDLLADPLMHMIRNSVDHGIESPAERVAAGKPASGVVRVDAFQRGDRVVVSLRDDGRGLQRARIIAKAIERGLIASGEGMADPDVFELIFSPGFSTADAVTEVSGRGVGMDVVRKNLLAMRGRTTIASVAGEGTTFTIELPLTLAITDGMIVRVGAERFIVPMARIRRCFRPAPDTLFTAHGRGELVRHGDEVLPLLRLHRALRIEGATERPADGILVVVGDGQRRVALLVDDLLGQQQVVAKPLGESIGRVRGLTGGAILGDGRVGLILDVDELTHEGRGATQADASGTEGPERHHAGSPSVSPSGSPAGSQAA